MRAGDAAGRKAARQRAHAPNIALGERASPWWPDGALDYNRHIAKTTPYVGRPKGLRVVNTLRKSPGRDSCRSSAVRVCGMLTGISISFSPSDRARLVAMAADRSSPQKHLWRAQIVLLSADGVGTNEIMRVTGTSKTCVWRWQQRVMEAGTDGLLVDKTRPSRCRRGCGLLDQLQLGAPDLA